MAGTAELSSAIEKLTRHAEGRAPLSADQINAQAAVIGEHIAQLGDSPRMIQEAFRFVAAYDKAREPLFLNKATQKGFPRKPSGGLELERAVFAVQQGLIDHAYTPANLKKYPRFFDGLLFGTSAYFPGSIEPPNKKGVAQRVKINASQPACWGSPVMYAEDPARRPTGCYLAPGSIVRISVPSSMVGKGYAVRVGAHSWDLKKKPKIKRLDRVSIVYPIEHKQTVVANPLGGGIYIEVPYEADAGVQEIKIENAVRSPFFSTKAFDKTSPVDWKTQRSYPAPWADFESDRFMLQVPAEWIRAYDDPAAMLAKWDTALDAVSDLFGRPHVRNKSVLYMQVDTIIRGRAFFPGYPQSNTPYNPHDNANGSDHWLLKGPQGKAATIFHELGHAQLFTKFRGEVEAVVNLPYVSVLNKGFGVDLDTAFGKSRPDHNVTLDQAAIQWMVTENFRAGKRMDITNSTKNEVRYQHRGYGKYVEIVNLFGWPALEKFWHSVQLDYLDGIQYSRNSDPTDSRILRMSKAAGADLTPLIHFWGVQPEDARALKKEMKKVKLYPSALIYDRLVHYKTQIPMNNAEFGAHAKIIYPKGLGKRGNPDYGPGWYKVWLPKYDKSHGKAAQKALQAIIETYFPNGRPEERGSSK
jgi:hypothetical protein